MRSGNEAQREEVQRKQTETNGSVFASYSAQLQQEDCCRRTSRLPHTRTNITFTQQMVTRSFCCSLAQTNLHSHVVVREENSVSIYICICVCMRACTYLNLSVPRCRTSFSLPNTSPCQPTGHKEMGKEHSGYVEWLEGRGKCKRERRRKNNRMSVTDD